MTTQEHKDLIGKEILSIEFGVGVITAIEKLQDDGDSFYVLEYGKKNVKNYAPMVDNKKIRFVASKDEFIKSMERLKAETIKKEFPSRKDRVNYFKGAFRNGSLDEVVNRILEINSISDLAPNEEEKVTKLIKTLESEAAIIYELTGKDSKAFISKYLTKKEE